MSSSTAAVLSLVLLGLTGCAQRSSEAGAAYNSPPGSLGRASAASDAAEPLASRHADASVRGDVLDAQPSPGLGTAYGEQRLSAVRSAPFHRADPRTPSALLSIRYDDEDGVQRMAQWKTGQSPRRANQTSGPISLTLRDDFGGPLPGAQIGDDLYAVATSGARYTIGVENSSPYRYEVVASVDGLDVIDGGDADLDKRGYLIDPYTSFVIEGWRTGDDTVAAFRFSDMDRSYAGRTGRPRDIGVIGLAFFHERGQPSDRELRRRASADPFPGRYAPPPPAD